MLFSSKLLRRAKKLSQMQSTSFRDLPLIIEWPKGSIRVGEDKNGKKWKREMQADYGYIPDTTAAGDKEGLDVYIGPDEASDKVYVVEQLTDDGEFDEYKVLMGFSDLDIAYETYLKHYPDGWGDTNVGSVSEVPFEQVFDKVEEHQEQQGKEEKVANTAPGTYPSRAVQLPRATNFEHYVWISGPFSREDHIMRGLKTDHTHFCDQRYYNPPLSIKEYDNATRGYAEVKNDSKVVILTLSPVCRPDFLYYPPTIIEKFKEMYPGYKIYTGNGKMAGIAYLNALTAMRES
jgi:hypothetical protein